MKTTPLRQPTVAARTSIIARLCGLFGLCALFSLTFFARAQTTNYFYEGFETAQALDDWTISSGTWEIGVPTFGPLTNSVGQRAFAGTNCAATVLGGNYTDNTSSRLISPRFVVPPAVSNPRLRFWHWYSFNQYGAGADFGVVQIKAGTNDWKAISPIYTNDSGGVWSRPSVDLSPYAGQNVQLAFYFESLDVFGNGGLVDVAPGWYIDEVTVLTGPITVNNPENWESGLGDWFAEKGTWQVGVPTFGPPTNPMGNRAFGGTNCAATVLGSNYNDNASSRLISPPFVVPPAVSNPRLRFWHWYSFNQYGAGADFGVVQIKAGTNDWKAISPLYTNDSGGVWSRPSVDLSPYAGQNVQLAFYFESLDVFGNGGLADVAPGWYIDEVTVLTGPITVNNPENWESGLGDWFAEKGTWQVGVPTFGPPTNPMGNRAFGGTNCAATVLESNYTDNASSRLISPPFVVPPAVSNPRLRFWHWFSFNQYGAGADFGEVQIKAGTNDWKAISPLYTNDSGGVWSRPSVDLSPYAGQNVQLAFYFESLDVFGNGGLVDVAPGWYIDEVRLTHDFALVLLDAPIVRAQDTFCLSLGIAESSPASTLSFTLQAPPGNLSNVTLSGEGCWTNARITPQPNSQWFVTLQNSCTTAPMGVKTIGSLCFTAVSAQSAFVPLTIHNLVVTNQDASLPPTDAIGSRAVIIAQEPLLEAWLDATRQRMVTIYGIAGETYEIRHASTVGSLSLWTPGWTNTVPASLFFSFPLQGAFSNAPSLYLLAHEQ